MATTCRICHPKQFDTEDPDPQQHITHVGYEEYLTEASESDDESGKPSTIDDDHEKNTLDKVKRPNNDEEEEGTEHNIPNSDQYNDNYNNYSKNADNIVNNSDETSDYEKVKREIHSKNINRKNRRGRRGKSKNSKRKSNERKISTTRIVMPTGASLIIPDIVVPHWKCGKKTKLVYLGPNNIRNREFDIVEAEMQNTIAHYDNCESAGGCFKQYNITKVQKIVQGCAWRRYQARKTDVTLEAGYSNERMLFHGTDAVWKIVSGGFDERFSSTILPAGTELAGCPGAGDGTGGNQYRAVAGIDGQFGAGLYFAQHSSLANQFVFGYFGGNGCKKHHDKNCYICDRHLLLCRVTLGKPYQLKSIENISHPPPGYHSVEALVGENAFQNPEFVIYRGEQAYPEYFITYKIVKPKEDDQDKPDSKRHDNGDNSKTGGPKRAVPAGNKREHATSTSSTPLHEGTNRNGRYPSAGVQNRQDGGYDARDSMISPSQRPLNVVPRRLNDRRGEGGDNNWNYQARGVDMRYDDN